MKDRMLGLFLFLKNNLIPFQHRRKPPVQFVLGLTYLCIQSIFDNSHIYISLHSYSIDACILKLHFLYLIGIFRLPNTHVLQICCVEISLQFLQWRVRCVYKISMTQAVSKCSLYSESIIIE